MTGRDESLSFGSITKLAAPPFVLSLLSAAMCYLAGGFSLGFYFGPLALAALIVPVLAASETCVWRALIVTAAACVGIAALWLIPVFNSRSTISQWFASSAVLAAYLLSLCGLVFILRRAFGIWAGAAIVALFALAWLTWPVWMSPWLTAPLVAWLAPAHPLLALNHVWIDLGVWTQQRLLYQLTALGQDVPYTLPESILPCVLTHVAIGIILLLPAAWLARRTKIAAPPPDSQNLPERQPPEPKSAAHLPADRPA